MAIAASQLAAAIALRILNLAAGWKADPTYPFGLLNPLVILPMLVYVVVLAPVALVSLSLVKSSRATAGRKASAAGLAVIAIMIALPTPLMPDGLDAFRWRMSSFPEAQFQALARDVRAGLEDYGRADFEGTLRDGMRARVVDALQGKHGILRVGDFPIDIRVEQDYVSIEWASGLTGGYEVSIVDGPEPPRGLPAANIHATVAAYRK